MGATRLESIFRKSGGRNFHLDSHEITAERRKFFFRKSRYFSDKKSKIDKFFFGNHEISTLF
jgi:hypothetical protein